MAIPLKFSTASQEVTFGQALDSTDGDTEEGALTIANTDIKLNKSGTTTLVNKNSGGGTYISNGVYHMTLDATDTNTYGPMTAYIHVAGALAMKVEFWVMNATWYDILFGTTVAPANVTQWLGAAAATPTVAGVPEVDLTHVSGVAEDVPSNTELNARTLPSATYFDSATDTVANVTNVATTTSVTNQVTSNVTAIAGNATAATNLETLYDGNEGFYSAYAGPRGPGVYLNDAAANTSTANGVDGTIGNPVSTIAAAKTIADSMSLDRIYLVNDSDITLAATMVDYEFIGLGEKTANVINLGSQDVSQSHFINLAIEGTQGGAGRIQAVSCALQDPGVGDTVLHIFADKCGIVDRIQVDTSNDNVFEACYSLVAGTGTPVIQATGVTGTISLRHYSGGIEFESLSATHNVSVETDGQVIFNASCNVNATVALRGMMTITDNTAGMSALSDAAAFYTILDDGAATYDRTTDSLQALRDRGDVAWTTGAGGTPPDLLQSTTIATLATQTSFTLTAGSADDSAYADQVAVFTDQVTGEQKSVRNISSYTGATKTVTLATGPDFTIAVGDTIEIVAATGAAGSGATAAEVWTYATRVLTANTNLNDPTSAAVADAVWDEARAGHVGAGSFGETMGTVETNIDNCDAPISTVDAVVDAILVDTNELQTDWADGGRLDLILDAILADTGTDGVVISATTANQIADALLNRDWTAVSDTNARTALNALRLLRNKYSTAGTTLTITKEDDLTTAWTSTVTTDAAADPITGSDPV